jgi:hypothetical protein
MEEGLAPSSLGDAEANCKPAGWFDFSADPRYAAGPRTRDFAAMPRFLLTGATQRLRPFSAAQAENRRRGRSTKNWGF